MNHPSVGLVQFIMSNKYHFINAHYNYDILWLFLLTVVVSINSFCTIYLDGTIDFSQISVIHTVSGAIKLFLRELPIPLITFDAYPVLLQCIKGNNIYHKQL